MTCLLELAITCGVNFGLSAGEHILRCHIANGAVQPHGVVVFYEGLNKRIAFWVSGVPGRSTPI